MKLKWIMLAVFYIPSSVLVAQPLSSTEQQKIDFLKSELVNSSCLFERNGKQYNAKKALKHINRKHSHFEDDIDSVSKFIELTATQSSMSGKPYFIICGDSKVESALWLKARLSQTQTNK